MSYMFEAVRPELLNTEAIPTNGQAAPALSAVLDLDEEKQVVPLPSELDPRLVALADPLHIAAERFRILSTRLYRLRAQHQLCKLLVTSAIPNEGKTLIAANLAITLANRKQKVLLLDGDLRESGLNGLFGLKGLRGLSDALVIDSPLHKCIYRLDVQTLWLLPRGTTTAHPLELQSPHVDDLLKTLCNSFDWIVIDSPPVVPFADADVWSRHCHGALLVVRHARTPKPELQKSLEILTGCPILGLVFNDRKEMRDDYYERYRKAANSLPSPSCGQSEFRSAP